MTYCSQRCKVTNFHQKLFHFTYMPPLIIYNKYINLKNVYDKANKTYKRQSKGKKALIYMGNKQFKVNGKLDAEDTGKK